MNFTRASGSRWFAFLFSLFLAHLATTAQPKKVADPAVTTSKLPLSRLTLYSSGVGYFQRKGVVEGKAEVELRFKVDDINDLLKSMVVQDFDGGQVQTVTYGSRDPITKTLKSFGIDLTSNPTLGQLLDQMRGEQAEIHWPNLITGLILGVEKKTQTVGENKVVETEHLNLVTADGLQSVALSQVQKIKLLNESINSELMQALGVLAKGHDTQKKTVSITFNGQGKRNVSVGYIAQTPVWKTSYRLVLEDNDKAFLQGWAIVENTSDEDWDNVDLSLISGRPISFTMDLYQPLYTSRPVVEPELYLSLRPQVYSESLIAGKPGAADQLVRSKDASRFAGGANQLGLGRQSGNSLEFQSLDKGERKLAETVGLNDWFFSGVSAAADGEKAGELFQYRIKSLVSLVRQKSAMLPIINDSVTGTKLSIYNSRVQAKYPLNGLRFKNTTGLHLMQGPVTVFDANTYAGDAKIEDLAPGQDRLISYGIDLHAEVEPRSTPQMGEVTKIIIKQGTIVLTRKMVQEMTYTVRNRDQKKKTVLIEHPYRSDWVLLEPTNKPERSREVYRFPVVVEAGKTEKLVVKEETLTDELTALNNSPNDFISIIIKGQKATPKILQALQNVMKMRGELDRTTALRTRREKEVVDISQEQIRIRENMARLTDNSELHIRYVKKLDAQETSLEEFRIEISGLKDTEGKQKHALDEYLGNLNLE